MRKLLFLSFAVCAVVLSSPVFAGVTPVQALDFGNFISKKNDAQYDIVVNIGGAYSYDSAGYIMISAPQYGIYDVDGLIPGQAIASVTVTQTAPLTAGAQTFNMVSITESHPANVDGAGVARIQIGATLRSTGTGVSYNDQSYTGSLEIQINY